MFARILCFGLTLLCASVTLAAPDQQPRPGPDHLFWQAVDALQVMLKAIGSLAGGPQRGEIWQYDISTRERTRIGVGNKFAWPVQGPDSQTIFALRSGQVVKIAPPGGQEASIGPKAAWRKLIGVAPDGVLGLTDESGDIRPAVLTTKGTLTVAPATLTDKEQEQIALLLQEDRAYLPDRRLMVSRSEHGGRGFDVYYITGRGSQNVSDCGDDLCGQPSLSADGQHVLYVRGM